MSDPIASPFLEERILPDATSPVAEEHDPIFAAPPKDEEVETDTLFSTTETDPLFEASKEEYDPLFDQVDAPKATPYYEMLEKYLKINKFYRSTTTAMGDGAEGLARNEDGTWDAPYINKDDVDPDSVWGKIMTAATSIDTLVGQKTGMRSDGWMQDDTTSTALNETLYAFQKDANLSNEEVQTAWKDMQAFYEPMKEEEPLRVLSDGRILPNRANRSWLDAELAEATIRSSNGSQAEKDHLLANLPEMQSQIALSQIEAYALGNVSLMPTDIALSGGKNWEGPMEWAQRTGREVDLQSPEFVKAYRNEVIDKRGLIDAYQSDLSLGLMKVANTIYGVGGLMGSEHAQEMSMKGVEATSLMRAGKRDTGIVGSIIEEVPSLTMQIGLTMVTGGLGSAAASGLGGSAAAVARTGMLSGSFASVTMSGAQSAAMTYGQLRSQGMTHEEAKSKSIDAGVSTGIITGIFQAAGMGGAEAAMVKGTASNKLMRDLYTAGMTREALGKAAGAFVKSLPKSYVGEFTEEGLDEVVNSFLTSDPNTSIATAWKDATHAAFVGGAIGISSHVVTGGFEKSLQLAGLSKTASALRTDVGISEAAAPSLAEARAQGIDPSTLVPSEVGADSTILKSSVDKKNGVSMARSGAKPTFLETIFGSPASDKEYDGGFDSSTDFSLEPIPGTKLEAVVHKGGKVKKYLDRAYDHESGTFVDMPADVKAGIESNSGTKVHSKKFFEARPKPVEAPPIAGSTPAIVAPTPVSAPKVASTQDPTLPEAPPARAQAPLEPGKLSPEKIGEQTTEDLRSKNDELRKVLRDNVTGEDDVSRGISEVAQEGINRISKELERRANENAAKPATPKEEVKADETETESSKGQQAEVESDNTQEAEEDEDLLVPASLPDEDVLSTSGEPTPTNYTTQGTRIHNQSELSKMVMAEEVVHEGQGVDEASGQVGSDKVAPTLYMDSHESETEGGGTNENVTIGAMPVGTMVVGKGADGKATKAYRVMKTMTLKNGAVRHYLFPLFDQDTGKLDQAAVDTIYAVGVTYAAKSRELEKAANEIIKTYLDGKKAANSPEVRAAIKQMVLDAFTYMVGADFTKSNVVFEAIGSPMHVTVEGGKPVIKVNLDKYVDDFISTAGRIDRKNNMGMRQVMFDLVERLRIAGLEELVHHQVIVDWALDTENGTKLSVSVNQLLDGAATNKHGKAELAKSARWVFGAETKNMTDDQVIDFLTERREGDQGAFNKDAWQIGHEMLASLYSRMKVGKDAASINATAARWANTMADGDTGLGKVLVARLIELANRYFQAIADFFKAYESVSHLPTEMIGLLRNLEDLMDKGGIKAPDVIGIQAAAVKQKMDVLDHPAVFAKDGYEFAQTQKQIREVISAMRQVRNDEDWVPITIAEDGTLIVTNDATDEERAPIQEQLDKLNSNKRAALTKRAMDASSDLNRMMTWINRAALTKRVKTKDDYGNPIEKTVSNFRQILDQPIAAVVQAFGPRETESTVLAAINLAIPKALQALMGITPEMLANPPSALAYYENSLINSGDKVGKKLINRVTEAQEEYDAAEKAIAELNAQEESLVAEIEAKNDSDSVSLSNPNARREAFDNFTAAMRKLGKELGPKRKALAKAFANADRELQERMINRDRYIRKLSEEEGKQSEFLAAVFADEDRYRAYLSATLDPMNRPIQSIGDLVSRRNSNPELVDFAVRVAYPKGGTSEAALDEIQSTSELGGAIGRLMRFKEELNYMLMGGSKPKHMWSNFSFSDIGKNVASGRFVDFAVLPQLFKGTFASTLMDVSAYDFSNQPEGVVKGREGFEFGNFSVRVDGGDQTVERMAANLKEGWATSSSLFGIPPLATGVRGKDGKRMSGAEKTDLMSSNARFINNLLIQDVYAANRLGDSKISTEVLSTMGFSLLYAETEAALEGDSITRYPTYPKKLLGLPDKFDINETIGERDYNQEALDLVNSPQFKQVISALARYVNESLTPNGGRTPSVFYHANGLTPAGLAFQAVAPKLIEFLAVTKEWSRTYDGKTISPYAVLTQDPEVKAAYDSLLAGLENTKPINDVRTSLEKSPYELVARFWELHRGAKVAEAIYWQAKQSGRNSKSMTWHLDQADGKLPISVDALQNSSFITTLLSRSSRVSGRDTKTFISLLRPIRAQRGIQLYNSIAPETDDLVIRKQQSEGAQLSQDIVGANEGDVVSRSGDFALQDEKAAPAAQLYGFSENSDKGLNLIEADKLNRKTRRERLEKWRSEMLLALLGGSPDAVIQFIHSDKFMIVGEDANGNAVAMFDEEGIDRAILEELERLQDEEILRGTVIDSHQRSYKEAVDALKSRINMEGTQAIDSKLEALKKTFLENSDNQKLSSEKRSKKFRKLLSDNGMKPHVLLLEGGGDLLESRGQLNNNEFDLSEFRAEDFYPQHIRERLAAIDLIQKHVSMVQKSVGVDTVQFDPAAFDADAYSLLTSIASTIPGLVFIEGSASWELQKDGPPSIVFVPDQDAPTIIMPYGGKSMASPAELQSALAEMFLWSSRNGGADLIGNANRVLETLAHRGLMNPGMRKLVSEQVWRGVRRIDHGDVSNFASGLELSDTLNESGGLDTPTRQALVEATVSRIVRDRKNSAVRLMDTRLDERIGQTLVGPILLQALTIDGPPANLTNEQAAAVIVAALTDRSVQEAMLLSIRSEPSGSNPTRNQMALRGNLLSPSLLASFTERYRNEIFGQLADGLKVTNAQGKEIVSGEEDFEGTVSTAVAEWADQTLQTGTDSVTTTNGEVLSIGTEEQTEWLSKLLHSLLDQVEPKFEGQADIDLIHAQNEQLGTNSSIGKAAPKGLVSAPLPPTGLSEMEARQIMSVMSEEHIANLVHDHTDGKGIAVTQDLMALNRQTAEIVRQAYNRIVNIEPGNKASEDAAYNYGTFTYDGSLWSDGSRRSAYEASRIMKGAIANGILDGGNTVLDHKGREYVRLDANIKNIMAERLRLGHAIFVLANDVRAKGKDGFIRTFPAGTPVSRVNADKLNTLKPGSIIQDIEFTQRQYFAEIDGYKAEIGRIQTEASKIYARSQAASDGIVELEGFFEDLKAADSQIAFREILEGSDHIDLGSGFFDAPDIIRAAFDGPEQLAGAVTDNILDLFADGLNEIGETVSYVPSAYSRDAGLPRSQFAFRADETPAEKTKRRLSEREQQKKLAIKKEKEKAAKAKIIQKYRATTEPLIQKIDEISRKYSRLNPSAPSLTSDMELDWKLSPLRAAIDQASADRDLALGQIGAAEAILESMANNQDKTAEQVNPAQVVRDMYQEQFGVAVKMSTTQEALALVSTQLIDELRRTDAKSSMGNVIRDLSNRIETVPTDDFEEQSQISTEEQLSNRFYLAARAHNARVSYLVDKVNARIPRLLDPKTFEISTSEGAKAKMAHFETILKALRTPTELHYMIKAKRAQEAIAGASLADLTFNDRLDPTKPRAAITSFDQIVSRGKGMLDANDRIKIKPEANLKIRAILRDDSIVDKKAAILPIVQEDLFPLHSASTVAATQLLDRMKRVVESDAALVGADLALTAILEAKKLNLFSNFPQALEWAIVRDVVRDMMQTRSREAQTNVSELLKQKAQIQAKYEHRRNSISAPRSNHASRMVYEGGPDSIEIVRRNHLERGLTWSRNHMAARNVRIGPNGQVYDQSNIDGMEDALDRMSRADMLAATASVLSQIESKSYDVVGNLIAPSGTLKPDGTTVIPLATSGFSLANAVNIAAHNADTPPVQEAKAAYQLLMRSDFFRHLDKELGRSPKYGQKTVSERLTDFDPITKLKENILRILINTHNAQAHPSFDNLGNHPGVDASGNPMVTESIKARLDPILARIGPNTTAAQLKDLVDIHNEIVAEALAARTTHDIALSIVNGNILDNGAMEYILNHDPSVRKGFAANAKGRAGVMEALGFISSGSTGHTGRQGYASAKNAWAELFVAEEKKLKGDRKFEDAAAGVMFHRVIDFLNATGKTSQQRAQTLIDMFTQATEGYSDALSASSITHIKGNKMQDIMKWPVEKLNDIKNDMTQDTFEMLQQRKVYEELRDYWVPRLEMVVGGKSIDALKTESWSDLTQQAKDWGDFVRSSMEHINRSLRVSAMMNGIDPTEFVQNRAMTPFRWRVFGREHEETEQFPDYGDVLAIDKASYRQSPTRRPKPGEIHMLDISGFTGPLHVIDDALNRIMMVDAYASFKAFAGVSVTDKRNKRTLTQMGSLYHHGQRLHEDSNKKLAHAASARLADIGQDIIHKDVFTVTDKSLIMDGVQQIARHGAVKALLSVKQFYAQVLPGLASYALIREGLNNKDFFGLFSKIVYSMVGGRLMRSDDLRVLGDNVDRFTLIYGPLIYRRTAGGEEAYHKSISKVKPSSVNRTSRTFGDSNKAKTALFATPNAVKKGAGVIVEVSEKMLHYAIATPESAFARSIFAHQIWKMVNEGLPPGDEVSFDDLVDPIKGKAYNITPAMINRAETMVNDMIASSDSSKKAELLQQSDNAFFELFRGFFSTFANHPLHTWGNTMAGIRMMQTGDAESKREGRRLIASNVFQNAVFQLTRIELAMQLIGIAAPLIASVFTDLDEEDRDAMRKRIVGSVYGINEDGSRKDGIWGMSRYLMMGLGSGDPLGYKAGEWSEADLKTDMTNVVARVLKEGVVQFVPGAATTLGSKGLDLVIEATVKKTLDPDGKHSFERAGMTIGEGPAGNMAEQSIYNVTKIYRNYLAGLSYFTIGLDSAIEPVMRLSNAQEDLGMADVPLSLLSEIPAIPRDFSSAIEKGVNEKMDAKIWSSFWEKQKRASSAFGGF